MHVSVNWSAWGTIISLLLAIIPAVVRFRDHLAKIQDLITEVAGVVVLLAGLVLYTVTVPQWVPVRTQLERLGPDVESLAMLFFGSITLTSIGALLTLFGLVGRITANLKNK